MNSRLSLSEQKLIADCLLCPFDLPKRIRAFLETEKAHEPLLEELILSLLLNHNAFFYDEGDLSFIVQAFLEKGCHANENHLSALTLPTNYPYVLDLTLSFRLLLQKGANPQNAIQLLQNDTRVCAKAMIKMALNPYVDSIEKSVGQTIDGVYRKDGSFLLKTGNDAISLDPPLFLPFTEGQFDEELSQLLRGKTITEVLYTPLQLIIGNDVIEVSNTLTLTRKSSKKRKGYPTFAMKNESAIFPEELFLPIEKIHAPLEKQSDVFRHYLEKGSFKTLEDFWNTYMKADIYHFKGPSKNQLRNLWASNEGPFERLFAIRPQKTCFIDCQTCNPSLDYIYTFYELYPGFTKDWEDAINKREPQIVPTICPICTHTSIAKVHWGFQLEKATSEEKNALRQRTLIAEEIRPNPIPYNYQCPICGKTFL